MREVGKIMTAALALLLGLSSCSSTSSSTDSGTDGSGSGLRWYQTCGAPVCRVDDGGAAQDGGVAACTVQRAGDPCSQGAPQCDPGVGCDVLLACADRDPRVQPGGCPISRRASKTEISYLDRAGIDRLTGELRRLRLATYRYRDAPERVRLGFMIDDAPNSVAVDSARDQIDLYSYLSMAVGALQAEADRIDTQEREIRDLQRRLDALTRTSRSPGRAPQSR